MLTDRLFVSVGRRRRELRHGRKTKTTLKSDELDTPNTGRWATGEFFGLRVPADPETLISNGRDFLTRAFRAPGARCPRPIASAASTAFNAGGTGKKLLLTVAYEAPAPGLPPNRDPPKMMATTVRRAGGSVVDQAGPDEGDDEAGHQAEAEPGVAAVEESGSSCRPGCVGDEEGSGGGRNHWERAWSLSMRSTVTRSCLHRQRRTDDLVLNRRVDAARFTGWLGPGDR
jgi:hypothetical protein